MRKSLVLSGVVLTAACIALLCVYWKIDSVKERVIVIEEPIWGDPAAASDITLEIASCLDDYKRIYSNRTGWNLLWDTKYTIDSGEEAESVFEFSSWKTGQVWGEEDKYIECSLQLNFGSVYGSDPNVAIQLEGMDGGEITSDIAERTAAGEERKEIVRLSDYYDYYPIRVFEIRNQNVRDITSIQPEHNNEYLTNFFHIPPEEDTAEVMVKKNEKDGVTYFHIYARSVTGIPSASVIGEKGCYYVYCCTDADGNYLDRGQNKGIFYTPYEWENDGGRIVVDWGQIRKVCDQPEGAIPVKMLLDEANGRLFLVLRSEGEFQLAIYNIEGEIPVFVQQISVLEGYEGEDGTVNFPCFQQMTVEEGGILLTWQDNTFSFVAEEKGQYRLWYSGKFPVDGQEDEILSQASAGERELRKFLETRSRYSNDEYFDIRQNVQEGNESFTTGNACFFDGQRLVLAAMSTWDNTNVLLSVYHEEGLAYCGLYELSEVYQSYMWFAEAYVAPQRFGEKGCITLQCGN